MVGGSRGRKCAGGSGFWRENGTSRARHLPWCCWPCSLFSPCAWPAAHISRLSTGKLPSVRRCALGTLTSMIRRSAAVDRASMAGGRVRVEWDGVALPHACHVDGARLVGSLVAVRSLLVPSRSQLCIHVEAAGRRQRARRACVSVTLDGRTPGEQTLPMVQVESAATRSTGMQVQSLPAGPRPQSDPRRALAVYLHPPTRTRTLILATALLVVILSALFHVLTRLCAAPDMTPREFDDACARAAHSWTVPGPGGSACTFYAASAMDRDRATAALGTHEE